MWFEALKHSLGLCLSALKKKKRTISVQQPEVFIDLQIRIQAAGKDGCGSCPVHTCQISGLEQSSSPLCSPRHYFSELLQLWPHTRGSISGGQSAAIGVNEDVH